MSEVTRNFTWCIYARILLSTKSTWESNWFWASLQEWTFWVCRHRWDGPRIIGPWRVADDGRAEQVEPEVLGAHGNVGIQLARSGKTQTTVLTLPSATSPSQVVLRRKHRAKCKGKERKVVWNTKKIGLQNNKNQTGFKLGTNLNRYSFANTSAYMYNIVNFGQRRLVLISDANVCDMGLGESAKRHFRRDHTGFGKLPESPCHREDMQRQVERRAKPPRDSSYVADAELVDNPHSLTFSRGNKIPHMPSRTCWCHIDHADPGKSRKSLSRAAPDFERITGFLDYSTALSLINKKRSKSFPHKRDK